MKWHVRNAGKTNLPFRAGLNYDLRGSSSLPPQTWQTLDSPTSSDQAEEVRALMFFRPAGGITAHQGWHASGGAWTG
jgi:hypothetical protein